MNIVSIVFLIGFFSIPKTFSGKSVAKFEPMSEPQSPPESLFNNKLMNFSAK